MKTFILFALTLLMSVTLKSKTSLITNINEHSNLKLPVSPPPSSPLNIKLSAYQNKLQITWTANPESDINHYNVYRSLTNDTLTATQLSIINYPLSIFIDNSPDYSKAYYYWIKAVDNAGQSSSFSQMVYSILLAVPTDGLIADYPLNGNANDTSGNGFNGTIYGGTFTSDRFGNANKAYSFNSNSYTQLGSNNLPSGNQPRTVSFWYNTSSTPTPQNDAYSEWCLFNYGSRNQNQTFTIFVYSDNDSTYAIRFDYYGSAFTGSQTLSINKWYNIAVSYDGTTVSIFINGNLYSSANVNLDTGSGFTTIGCWYPSIGWPFYATGYIDDIEIYNRALSNLEIKTFSNITFTKNINFGANQKFTNETISATILNQLTDTLHITNITHKNLTNFQTGKDTLLILPMKTAFLPVTFNSTKNGFYADTLLLFGNHPLMKVVVHGTSVTNLCGVITTDSTLTKANSPYYISKDCFLSIDQNKTLTIQHGVTILADSSVEILVDGTLKANGILGDSIVFTNVGNSNFDKIYFRTGSQGKMSYFKLQNSNNEIVAENGTLTLKHGLISNNSVGMSLNGMTIEFDSTSIINNSSVGMSGNGTNGNINYCNISNNNGAAVSIGNGGSAAAISMNANIISNNAGWGIYFDDNGSKTIANTTVYKNANGIHDNNATITNCTINQNSGDGIDAGSCEISGNSIIANFGKGISGGNLYIHDNSINYNLGDGINTSNNIIENNIINANNGNGITANGVTIRQNIITNNLLSGVYCSGVDSIEYNQIDTNLQNGIIDPSGSIIRYNNILNNGFDGINTSALPTINFNNIYGNYKTINTTKYYDVRATMQATNIIDATNNFWNTTTSSTIALHIYDYYDAPGVVKVNYNPFLNYNIIIQKPTVDSITINSAQIQFDITPNNVSTSIAIEYGLTTSYGSSVIATPTTFNGTSSVHIIGNITGLTKNTTYHYHIKAINASATYYSDDFTFTTLPMFTAQNPILTTVNCIGSMAWGDYNNDGFLDILTTGTDVNNNPVSYIFKNNGDGTFTQLTNISLTGVTHGSAVWGDYNNDGYLDILITGCTDYNCNNHVSKIYKNNGDGTFTEQTGILLTGIQDGSVSWGDYNNDGWLDILIAGATGNYPNNNCVSKIYKNNGNGTFTEQTNISLTGVDNSSVAWGDYNNDGYLDIFLTGRLTGGGAVSKLYKNNGDGTFTEQSKASFSSFENSSVAWGDYNNDGWLDILASGKGPITKIYKNNGNGTFTEQTGIALTGIEYGSVAWGDYNNDGWLDIITAGSNADSYAQLVSNIYESNGDGTFTEQTAISLYGAYAVAWGDYYNDGNLDFLLSACNASKIYKNNSTKTNTPPTAPTNLNATQNLSSITITWNKATDAETPQNGLYYNVRAGTASGLGDVVSPMSLPNGKRTVGGWGNAGQNTKFILNNLIQGKTYYYSVQTIDNGFAASGWSTEQSFTLIKQLPDANTQSTTNIQINSATLSGTVSANGTSTTVTFEYGTQAGNYGTWTSVAASPNIVTGTANTLVTSNISGLAVNTIYYYHVKAINSYGTTTGVDLQFQTPCYNISKPTLPTGLLIRCMSNSTDQYSTTISTNATYYNWKLIPVNAGSLVVTGQTATITWNQSFVGIAKLCVAGINSTCFSSTSDTLFITTNPLPTSALIGEATICNGQNVNLTFSFTGAAPWNLTYTDGTTPVTINNISSSPKIISVSPTVNSKYTISKITDANSCSNSGLGAASITVKNIPAKPDAIAGDSITCINTTTAYSISPVIGATSYIWTLPQGATGSSATNNIQVTFGTNGAIGILSVQSSNNCGNSAAKSINITIVDGVPAQAGTISGATSVCTGQQETYSIAPVNNASSFIWNLPTGTTGNSSTNSIDVTFGQNSASGNITVYGKNGCGNGTSNSVAVIVNKTPDVPIISGDNTVCTNQPAFYKTDAHANLNFNWLISGGTINAGQNTNEIQVLWNTSGVGTINLKTVDQNSACFSTASQFNVTVNNLAVLDIPEIIPKFNRILVCKNINRAYTAYQWYNQSGIISGATNQYYISPTILQGNYYVVTNDKNGCSVESTHLSVSGTKSGQQTIYPNPATGKFNILIGNEFVGKIYISLYNMMGSKLQQYVFAKNEYVFEQNVNINNYPTGIYYVSFIEGTEQWTEKLIIE